MAQSLLSKISLFLLTGLIGFYSNVALSQERWEKVEGFSAEGAEYGVNGLIPNGRKSVQLGSNKLLGFYKKYFFNRSSHVTDYEFVVADPKTGRQTCAIRLDFNRRFGLLSDNPLFFQSGSDLYRTDTCAMVPKGYHSGLLNPNSSYPGLVASPNGDFVVSFNVNYEGAPLFVLTNTKTGQTSTTSVGGTSTCRRQIIGAKFQSETEIYVLFTDSADTYSIETIFQSSSLKLIRHSRIPFGNGSDTACDSVKTRIEDFSSDLENIVYFTMGSHSERRYNSLWSRGTGSIRKFPEVNGETVFRISPKGKYLVYSKQLEGRYALSLIDSKSFKTVTSFEVPYVQGTVAPRELHFSANERFIFLPKHEKRSGFKLASYNIDRNVLTDIYAETGGEVIEFSTLDVSDDGSSVAFQLQYMDNNKRSIRVLKKIPMEM